MNICSPTESNYPRLEDTKEWKLTQGLQEMHVAMVGPIDMDPSKVGVRLSTPPKNLWPPTNPTMTLRNHTQLS